MRCSLGPSALSPRRCVAGIERRHGGVLHGCVQGGSRLRAGLRAGEGAAHARDGGAAGGRLRHRGDDDHVGPAQPHVPGIELTLLRESSGRNRAVLITAEPRRPGRASRILWQAVGTREVHVGVRVRLLRHVRPGGLGLRQVRGDPRASRRRTKKRLMKSFEKRETKKLSQRKSFSHFSGENSQ